jgi:hypothetical protein
MTKARREDGCYQQQWESYAHVIPFLDAERRSSAAA